MNCLKDAVLNEEVFVVDIEHTALMKRRLMDLGFVPGTGVTPVLESPSRDMRAYLIKGCKIALRSEDSERILIKGGCICCLKSSFRRTTISMKCT